MATPQSTPLRHAKLGIASTKSLPLANDYKKLLNDQHQRLSIKHQQDLDLIDDIRGYVKARLSIEREYTSALSKLAKQHANHISKKFTLLNQCDRMPGQTGNNNGNNHNTTTTNNNSNEPNMEAKSQEDHLRSRLDSMNQGPERPVSLYRVWSEHIGRLRITIKNRSDQFEQLILIVDKLKDIRSHKALIGKKCLDTHLKRIHEDIMVSVVELERARKLYYEDENQAKKARENEEKIKKKRSGLLTKFTDLQAKKEKTLAQREATDIQSTQARNDYIMALAAANAHLQQYYDRDLGDFIQLIDDGVLDHCRIFMATLSECDISSLKDSLHHAQYWSKLINSTGSQQTNSMFLDCDQSISLRSPNSELLFEPCNNDPIQSISLEHNADYALQHEIDKWFTWFKKECRNLSQLMHTLDVCQHAFNEGKKSIDLNGQTIDNIEGQIIELKQQIRKCQAAKLKAQARLKVIKEGGMQIEEWSTVESEIRADCARAQEELKAKRLKEMTSQQQQSSSIADGEQQSISNQEQQQRQMLQQPVQLQVSKDSDLDEGEMGGDPSMQNLASISRSTSNLVQKQQNAISGYSALTDPSLVWQDDYSNAWGSNQQQSQQGNQQQSGVVVTPLNDPTPSRSPSSTVGLGAQDDGRQQQDQYEGLLSTTNKQQSGNNNQQQQKTSVSIQSSSPLSAIVNGSQHLASSSYQVGMMTEAYKSDYECDYNTRTGQLMRSTASSAEPSNSSIINNRHNFNGQPTEPAGKPLNDMVECQQEYLPSGQERDYDETSMVDMRNRRVIALYDYEKNNDDDLAFMENDLLLIVDNVQDDENWLKARNETTGEEGYIPASYVRIYEDEATQVDHQQVEDDNVEWEMGEDKLENQKQRQKQQQESQPHQQQYCRALYDYKPDDNTFEDDGLPHLSLVQGELMKIIDQGDDDGWWLVEKEDPCVRGHVPSMLVEEIDLDEEEEEGDAEDDDLSGSVIEQDIDHDDHDGTLYQPPDFEPPKLEQASDVEISKTDEESEAQTTVTIKENVSAADEGKQKVESTQASNSLIPTSFIIIEPTPEVESKRFEDGLKQYNHGDGEHRSENDKTTPNNTDSEQATDGSSEETQQKVESIQDDTDPDGQQQPISYSVINEDFVLEKPTRKPYQANCDQMNETATPTILEESFGEEQAKQEDGRQQDQTSYEPLSEVDSVGDAAPVPSVSVIICSCENKPRSIDEEDEEDQLGESNQLNDEATELDQDEQQKNTQYVERRIKHTGNVDVSPILRHRADEFSRQIIEEAVMLAPGAEIGPSTSPKPADDYGNQNDLDDDFDDYEDDRSSDAT